MKKLLALGISTVTAAAIVLAPAAAHAEDPVDDSVIPTVCTTLGDLDLTDLLSDSAAAETAANEAVDAAETAVSDALSDYVAAVIDTLEAVDSDGDVASAETIMNANFEVLVNKIVAWSEAMVEQFTAHQEAFSATLQGNLLSELTEGLCPVA